MLHLVQISNGSSRRVAIVEEPRPHCLTGVQSVYELAQLSLNHGRQLSDQAIAIANGEVLDYDAIYAGISEWRLLAHRRTRGAVAPHHRRDGPHASGKRAGETGHASRRYR